MHPPSKQPRIVIAALDPSTTFSPMEEDPEAVLLISLVLKVNPNLKGFKTEVVGLLFFPLLSGKNIGQYGWSARVGSSVQTKVDFS